MATVSHLGLFPFCITGIEERPLAFPDLVDLYQPMTLKQAMALFWKVKKIKITGEVLKRNIETGEYEPYRFSGITNGTGFAGENYPVLNNETDLICNGIFRSWVVDDPKTSAISLAIPMVDFIEQEPNDPTYYALKKEGTSAINDGGKMLPSIWFTWGNEEVSSYGESSYDKTSGYSKIDLKSYGTLEWGLYAIGQGTIGAGFFEAEVIEFWPYDPNDGGGPIYDTSTGERIRFDV